MKNNYNDQPKITNQNDQSKAKSDERMREQNRDIINEGKNLAKNSNSRHSDSKGKNQ